MIKPYFGEEKYIFISYAHKDSDKVFLVINELNKNGYRVWYDEGIEVGEEWPEIIAQKLYDAHLILCFISSNYSSSLNCKRELNFAISENKSMFAIYLDDASLSLGMKMQLGTIQSIKKDEYNSIDNLIYKLFNNPCMNNNELKMTVDEFNALQNVQTESNTLVYELTIAIGICVHDHKIAMVKRSVKEGNLLWQFPAAAVKASEIVEKKIVREFYQEVGLKTEFIKFIGTRIHPNTHTKSYYCALKYLDGELYNADDYENQDAKFVDIDEYKNYITSSIYEGVENYIKEWKDD